MGGCQHRPDRAGQRRGLDPHADRRQRRHLRDGRSPRHGVGGDQRQGPSRGGPAHRCRAHVASGNPGSRSNHPSAPGDERRGPLVCDALSDEPRRGCRREGPDDGYPAGLKKHPLDGPGWPWLRLDMLVGGSCTAGRRQPARQRPRARPNGRQPGPVHVRDPGRRPLDRVRAQRGRLPQGWPVSSAGARRGDPRQLDLADGGR